MENGGVAFGIGIAEFLRADMKITGAVGNCENRPVMEGIVFIAARNAGILRTGIFRMMNVHIITHGGGFFTDRHPAAVEIDEDLVL